MNIQAQKQGSCWWGVHSVELDDTLCWEMGSLTLAVQRRAREWQIMSNIHPDQEPAERWQLIRNREFLIDGGQLSRFMFKETMQKLQVIPKLADRPVVIRPATPFHVPAGQTVTLFVSSPVWFSLAVHKPPVQLLEMPIQRPSDTWFGLSTCSGELCYASRTQGRIRLDELPKRTDRAVTPIIISNLSDASFLLERVNLPSPNLSLFCNAAGCLWTPQVTMTREPGDDSASLEIAEGPPSIAGDTELISSPRQQPEPGSLLHYFGALFS
jgi:hypothetical protein